MNPTPPTPKPATPATPPALRYSPDVTARMKATGVDPIAAEKRLATLPRDQAETTWANVVDYYRRSTDMASKVAAIQGADKAYQDTRMRQPTNEKWTAFDDLGASFKNSFVDLAQGVSDLIPSTVDLAMSAVSNPNDDTWYRQWDKATDDYFAKAKYYVSPEAQAAVYDEKTGLNWRAVAGMTGSTLGFLTTTMLPMVGAAGRVGEAAQAVSAGSKVLRVLTDPRLQSGAIGYLQALPGYKEAAMQAGYTRNQAALIAPILSSAQAVLEFAGADALMKTVKLAPSEAAAVVRQLGKESAADAFKQLAGKPLTEETFRDVINATGKGFFGRLKTPEIRNAIWQNIKAGGASELVEEVVQQGAESAIQKMADIYYGHDQKGGKGFDPTLKQTLIGMGVGGVMGGIVGGSMGGMLGRTPTYVGQQTVWGMLDSNVRELINKNPDLSLDNNKDGLTIYRLTDKLKEDGKLSDQEYQQARANLDRMTGVSARLAKTSADTPTRFALFNLDSEQQQWAQRLQTEVQAPMQRLTQLADEAMPGQWVPKSGLSTLDLAEAQELINQDLPRKAQLATTINQSIEESVKGLMNPATRQQTLRSYKPMLDGLADQWENGPSDTNTPTRPDQFAESEVEGLSHTMDTPDGRYALADGPAGREVYRVETATDGQQANVGEDKDPTVGRFKGYRLPSKGRPLVRLHTIADQTRQDQLLSAFDNNPDTTEPYGQWRERLADRHADNELDGLRQAETRYQAEADSLPDDAPDWQKQDLARKRSWLKSAMASRAADSGETRYGWADWAAGYLPDQLAAAGITREQLASAPAETHQPILNALQAGDYQQATALVNTPPTQPTTTNESTASGPDELPAQVAAAEERERLIANVQRATAAVLERAKVIDDTKRLIDAGDLEPGTQQRLVDEISLLERALDAESDAISALHAAESGGTGSPETGAGEPETGSGEAADSANDINADNQNSEESGEGSADVVSPQVNPVLAKKIGLTIAAMSKGFTDRQQVQFIPAQNTNSLINLEDTTNPPVYWAKNENGTTMATTRVLESRHVKQRQQALESKTRIGQYLDILTNRPNLNEELAQEGFAEFADQQKQASADNFQPWIGIRDLAEGRNPDNFDFLTEEFLSNAFNRFAQQNAAGADTVSSQDELGPQKRKTDDEKPIIRQAQDLREAILQWFDGGRRIRRSDMAHYGDPNLMRNAKGGNPYLRYTTGDDKAPSLDIIAREIIEEHLGRPVEDFDTQSVMQQIVDTIQSFSADGPPRKQLIDYQRLASEETNRQTDAQVEEATATTPVQLLGPMFAAMDRAEVPTGIQDQIANIIAENYITADGLDWVGVMHLLRANGLFEKYDDLRNSMLPFLDEVARQVPTTNEELREESKRRMAEQRSDVMSNVWWQEMADQQAIPDDEFNAALDFFYGDPTKQPTQQPAGELPAGDSPVRTTQEDSGLPDQGDSQTGESGQDPADDRLEQAVAELTPEQETVVSAAQAQYDADIALLERDNARLQTQADKLRKDLRSRTQTGDLFANQPSAPVTVGTRTLDDIKDKVRKEIALLENGLYSVPGSPNTILKIENGVPVGYGRMENGQFVSDSSPEVLTKKGTSASIDAENFNARLAKIRQLNDTLAQPFYTRLADFVNQHGPKKATELLKNIPGGPTAISTFIVLPSAEVTRIRQVEELDAWLKEQGKPKSNNNAQADLFAGETSGIDAENSAKKKLADLETQISANDDRIANLKQARERAAEIAVQAPAQAALFGDDAGIWNEPPADQQAEPEGDISTGTISTDNEGIAAEEAIAEQPQALADDETPAAQAQGTDTSEESGEELSVEQQAEADETLGKLTDFGEKIGAARKDTAERGFSRGKQTADATPSWAKPFQVFANKLGTFDVAITKGHFMKVLQRGFKSEAEAQNAIPLIVVSRNHRVYEKAKGNYAIYRVYSNGKVWSLQDGFETRDDAMRYMAQNAADIITRKSPIVERPHLDNIQRDRPDVRGGKNATPQMLLDTFGFRGGEFGNWLAADERQSILNMAYDAFMDLATVLGVTPRALSMGGELSIGFGSRGKGLSSAAAHYETSRAVINLTKVKGAGSLAHEWFHAFDNYLAKQDGKAPGVRLADGTFEVPSKERAYFSHGKSISPRSKIRQQLADLFDVAWKAISEKTIQREREVTKTQAALERTKERVQSGLASLRKSIAEPPAYRKKQKPATSEQLARFDALTDELLSGNLGERKWVQRERSQFKGGYMFPAEQQLYALVKEVTGRMVSEYDNVGGQLYSYNKTAQEHQQATAGELETVRVKTDFFLKAKDLDASRASAYWGSPHELFARAFEAYVQDKIAEGGASQYLIHGADNVFYAMYGLKPYPEGQERIEINAALDALFGGVQTKEGENGLPLFYDITQPKPGRTAINAIFGQTQQLSEDLSDDELDRRQEYRSELLELAQQQIQSERDYLDSPRRRSALLAMRKAMKDFDAGKITEDGLMTAMDQVYAQLEARHADRQNQDSPDRVRGADYIRQRLLEAKRRGDLDAGGVDMAEWFLQQNPSLADEVGISIRTASPEQDSISGFYNPLAKIVTLFKGSGKPDTGVHELLHHSEQLMPADIQAGIQKEYARSLAAALKSPDANVRTFAQLIVDGKTNDAVDMIKRNQVDYDAAYPLINASEYWAVKATQLLSNRFANRSGWLAKAGQWLNEFIEKAKGFFGLTSDAPIIQGLNSVLTPGNNTLQSPMLANASAYNQLYGARPTPNDQPVRPIVNQGASALTTLGANFKAQSAHRQTLLAQPAPQLARYLSQTFQPMIHAILEHAPGTPVANQLLKVRTGGVTLVDPATGLLDASVLNQLASELVNKRPKGSDATGRLRNLLWEGAQASGISKLSGMAAEPDVLTAYREALTEKAIIDEDGNYEWPDAAEENRDAYASVDSFDENASDPAAVRMLKKLVTSKFMSNVLNPEAVGKLLSLGDSSSLQRITKDIRRVWVSRAAEVRLRRGHLLNELQAGLQGLSRFATPSGKVGDISASVKTYALKGWQNGTATTLDLPIGDWLDIYFTTRTQLATTGRRDPNKATSTILADVDSSGRLVASRTGINSKNQPVQGAYGYQYFPPGETKPQTVLIDRATYTDLENRLRAEHGNLLDTVDQLFSDPVARQYLSGLYEVENGTAFPMEADYYPTQAWRSAAERDVVPTVGGLLENARILRERKTPPLKVAGRDILARVNSYVGMEHRYIANSATRLNLTRWRQRNADALDRAPDWLTGYLTDLENDLNDGGANTPDEKSFEFEVGGVDLGLRAWMRRFSRSTFAFSLTTGPKQLLTHLNAYGMGIIDNQYLRQSAADLGRLAVDSYKLAKQNDDTSLFGGTLAEKAYLDELASYPTSATLMDRLIGPDEAYLGRPTMDDLKAQPVNGSIALARKAAHTVSDYGLRWVRASDRAVILSFFKAAQYQVADQVAAGKLIDESGNPVTSAHSDYAMREVIRLTEELTYATNTMSGEGDATPLQRNKGLAGAMLGLYSGQQQRLASTCISAINDYLKARHLGDPSADELRKQAIWTSLNLVVFNAVGVGLVNLLYRAIKGAFTDKEPTAEEVLGDLATDVGRGLLGTVPSVPTELLIAASTWVDGPKWSDDVLGYAPGQSFQRVVEGMAAGVDYMNTDDPQKAAKRWDAMTAGLVDGGAHLAGIPVQIPKLLADMNKEKPAEKESAW